MVTDPRLLQLETAVKDGQITTKNYLAKLALMYNQNPESFDEDSVDLIEKRFKAAGLPFNRDLEAGETNILQMTHQLIGGVFEGFTTFNVTRAPEADTSAERILRSVGHLIGFIPDIIFAAIPSGGLTKGIAWASISSKLGKLGLSAKKVSKIKKSLDQTPLQTKLQLQMSKVVHMLPKTFRGKVRRRLDTKTDKMVAIKDPKTKKWVYPIRSFPMQFADVVTEQAAKYLGTTGRATRVRLQKTLVGVLGKERKGLVKQTIKDVGWIAQGATHLGLAGMASSHPWASGNIAGWRGMLEGSAHMALAGGIFRTIGTYANVAKLMKNPTTRPFAEKYLRKIANEIYAEGAAKALQLKKPKIYGKPGDTGGLRKARTTIEAEALHREANIDRLFKSLAGAGYGFGATAAYDLPLPEQIYEVLLGMFFSASEQPRWKMDANKAIYSKKKYIEPDLNTVKEWEEMRKKQWFQNLPEEGKQYMKDFFNTIRAEQAFYFQANPRMFFDNQHESFKAAAAKAVKEAGYTDLKPETDAWYKKAYEVFGKYAISENVDWSNLTPAQRRTKLNELRREAVKEDKSLQSARSDLFHLLEVYDNAYLPILEQMTSDSDPFVRQSVKTFNEVAYEVHRADKTIPVEDIQAEIGFATQQSKGDYNKFLNILSGKNRYKDIIKKVDKTELRKAYNQWFVTLGQGSNPKTNSTGRVLNYQVTIKTKLRKNKKSRYTFKNVTEHDSPQKLLEIDKIKKALDQQAETGEWGKVNTVLVTKNTFDQDYGPKTMIRITKVQIDDGNKIRDIRPLQVNDNGEPIIPIDYWTGAFLKKLEKDKYFPYAVIADSQNIMLLKYPWATETNNAGHLTPTNIKAIYKALQSKGVGEYPAKTASLAYQKAVVAKYIWRLRLTGLLEGKNLSGKKGVKVYTDPKIMKKWSLEDPHRSVSSLAKRLKLPVGTDFPLKQYWNSYKSQLYDVSESYDPKKNPRDTITFLEDNIEKIYPQMHREMRRQGLDPKKKKDKERFIQQYHNRTFRNAYESDVTLAIAIDFSSPGEKLTKRYAIQEAKKLYIPINAEKLTPEIHAEKIISRIKKRFELDKEPEDTSELIKDINILKDEVLKKETKIKKSSKDVKVQEKYQKQVDKIEKELNQMNKDNPGWKKNASKIHNERYVKIWSKDLTEKQKTSMFKKHPDNMDNNVLFKRYTKLKIQKSNLTKKIDLIKNPFSEMDWNIDYYKGEMERELFMIKDYEVDVIELKKAIKDKKRYKAWKTQKEKKRILKIVKETVAKGKAEAKKFEDAMKKEIAKRKKLELKLKPKVKTKSLVKTEKELAKKRKELETIRLKETKKRITINIAGNSLSKWIRSTNAQGEEWTQELVNKYVYDVLEKVDREIDIKLIRSGGQSGADEAGAIAGATLGKNTLVLMPKFWRFTNEDNLDTRWKGPQKTDIKIEDLFFQNRDENYEFTDKRYEEFEKEHKKLINEYHTTGKSKADYKKHQEKLVGLRARMIEYKSLERFNVKTGFKDNTGHFRMVFVKDSGRVQSMGMNKAEDVARSQLGKDHNALLTDEANTDGALIVLPEFIKTTSNNFGLRYGGEFKEQTGALKGTINIPAEVNADKSSGQISLKLEMFEADPHDAKFMRANNITHMAYMTTLKEGNRNIEKNALRLDPELPLNKNEPGDWSIGSIGDTVYKKNRTILDNDMPVYKMRVEDIYLNMSAIEDFGKIGNVRLSKPVIALANKGEFDNWDMFKDLMKTENQGIPKETRKFKKFVNDNTAFNKKTLDIDNIKSSEISKYVRGALGNPEKAPLVMQSVLRQALSKGREDINFDWKMENLASKELLDEDINLRLQAESMLERGNYNIVVQLKNNQFIQEVVNRYLIDREQTPRIKYSATALLTKYDKVNRQQFKLKNDEFIMSEGFALNFEVPIYNKEGKLVYVFKNAEDFLRAKDTKHLTPIGVNRQRDDYYNTLSKKDKPSALKMLKDVRFTFIRDPIIDNSNIRILKLSGVVSGRKGLGVSTNAFNRMMMSGSDIDGDKANVFVMKPEWNRQYGKREIQYALNEGYSEFGLLQDIKDPEDGMRLAGAEQAKSYDDSFNTLNIGKSFETGLMAGKGFSLLGKADIAKKIMRTVHDLVEQGKVDFGAGLEIRNKTEASLLNIESTKLSNILVDGSTLTNVEGYKRILSRMWENHFEVYRDGKRVRFKSNDWDDIIDKIPYIKKHWAWQQVLVGRHKKIEDFYGDKNEIRDNFLLELEGFDAGHGISARLLKDVSLDRITFSELVPQADILIKKLKTFTNTIVDSDIFQAIKPLDDYYNNFLKNYNEHELKYISSNGGLFFLHIERALGTFKALRTSEVLKEELLKMNMPEDVINNIITNIIYQTHAIKSRGERPTQTAGQELFAVKKAYKEEILKDLKSEVQDLEPLTGVEKTELLKKLEHVIDDWHMAYPIIMDNPYLFKKGKGFEIPKEGEEGKKETYEKSMEKWFRALRQVNNTIENELRESSKSSVKAYQHDQKLQELYKKRGGIARDILGKYHHNDRNKAIKSSNYKEYVKFINDFFLDAKQKFLQDHKLTKPDMGTKYLNEDQLESPYGTTIEESKVFLPTPLFEKYTVAEGRNKFPTKESYDIRADQINKEFMDIHIETNGRWSGIYSEIFAEMGYRIDGKGKLIDSITLSDMAAFNEYLRNNYMLKDREKKLIEIKTMRTKDYALTGGIKRKSNKALADRRKELSKEYERAKVIDGEFVGQDQLAFLDPKPNVPFTLFRGLAYKEELGRIKTNMPEETTDLMEFHASDPIVANFFSQRGITDNLGEFSKLDAIREHMVTGKSLSKTIEGMLRKTVEELKDIQAPEKVLRAPKGTLKDFKDKEKLYDKEADPRVYEYEIIPKKILDLGKNEMFEKNDFFNEFVRAGMDKKIMKNIVSSLHMESEGVQVHRIYEDLIKLPEFFNIAKSLGYDLVKIPDILGHDGHWSFIPLGPKNLKAVYNTTLAPKQTKPSKIEIEETVQKEVLRDPGKRTDWAWNYPEDLFRMHKYVERKGLPKHLLQEKKIMIKGELKIRPVPQMIYKPASAMEISLNNIWKGEEWLSSMKDLGFKYKEQVMRPIESADDDVLVPKYELQLSHIASWEREYNNGEYQKGFDNTLEITRDIINEFYDQALGRRRKLAEKIFTGHEGEEFLPIERYGTDKDGKPFKNDIDYGKDVEKDKDTFQFKDKAGNVKSMNLYEMIDFFKDTQSKVYTNTLDTLMISNFWKGERKLDIDPDKRKENPVGDLVKHAEGPIISVLNSAYSKLKREAAQYTPVIPKGVQQHHKEYYKYVLEKYLYRKNGLRIINTDKVKLIIDHVINSEYTPEKFWKFAPVGEDMNWIVYEIKKLTHLENKFSNTLSNYKDIYSFKGEDLKELKAEIKKYERREKFEDYALGELTNDNRQSNAYNMHYGYHLSPKRMGKLEKIGEERVKPFIDALPVDKLPRGLREKVEKNQLSEEEAKKEMWNGYQQQMKRAGVQSSEVLDSQVEREMTLFESLQASGVPGGASGNMLSRGDIIVPLFNTSMDIPFVHMDKMMRTNLKRITLIRNHLMMRDYLEQGRKNPEMKENIEEWNAFLSVNQRRWMNYPDMQNPIFYGYQAHHMLMAQQFYNDDLKVTEKLKSMIRKGDRVMDREFIKTLEYVINPSRPDQVVLYKQAFRDKKKALIKQRFRLNDKTYKDMFISRLDKPIANLRNYYFKVQAAENNGVLFIFGENVQQKGKKVKAPSQKAGSAVLRGLNNAIGIRTKWAPNNKKESFFSDKDFPEIKKMIDEDIKQIQGRFYGNKGHRKVIIVGKPGGERAKAPEEMEISQEKVLKYLDNAIANLEPNPTKKAVTSRYDLLVHKARKKLLKGQLNEKNIDKIGFFKEKTIPGINYTFSTNLAYYTSERKSVEFLMKWEERLKKVGYSKLFENLPEDTLDNALLRRQMLRDNMRMMAEWEGQYNLLALLAHPKASITNVYSGELNIVADVGLDHWRKAFDLDYLRDVFKGEEIDVPDPIHPGRTNRIRIGPDSGIAEFMRLAQQRRFISGTLLADTKYDNRLAGKRSKEFMKAVSNKVENMIQEKPELFENTKEADILYEKEADRSLWQLQKDYKVGKRIFDFGAAFMGKTEILLRMHTGFANYIHLRDQMGRLGRHQNVNKKFLWDHARLGIERAQYIYHATRRMPGANSPLGKMVTRFHPFTWNSLRRWNKIYQNDKVGRILNDSEASIRLQRQFNIAMMQTALATLFFSSIFEYSLAPPMAWIEDIIQLVFGDDEEKKRAFYNPYGVPALSPLAVVTPPSARLVLGPFKALVTGEWEMWKQYTLPTYVPYGRLGRDVVRTWQNPVMIGENIIGAPIHRFAQIQKTKRNEAIKYWENEENLDKMP